jgi:hypothetical protein
MPFNVNDIRAQLSFGGARSSLFQVQIQNPVNATADLKVPFMVKASTIPASNISEVEVPYFGRRIKMAGDRTFEPWSVTVINDEDFLIRNAMENWMASINTHRGNINNLGTSSPVAYKAQAQVTQYSKTGQVLRAYTFTGLFPTSVAATAVAWDAGPEPQEFEVTFSYDWWEVTGGITGNAGTDL